MLLVTTGCVVFSQKKPDSKKPDEQIKVNKEYDEKGNLIGYDSTYVRSWSSDSTQEIGDIDAIRKEMENFMKGKGFSYFFGDSTGFAGDPFGSFRSPFFDHFEDLPDSAFDQSDSTGVQFPFSDFGKMHEQMMKQFGQFFKGDSINSGAHNFNFFFDQDQLEKMQKEMEKHFNQQKDSDIKKMGGSTGVVTSVIPI
jgi:hypothetical protein